MLSGRLENNIVARPSGGIMTSGVGGALYGPWESFSLSHFIDVFSLLFPFVKNQMQMIF